MLPNALSCQHGHLARSCDACFDAREIAELRALLGEARAWVMDTDHDPVSRDAFLARIDSALATRAENLALAERVRALEGALGAAEIDILAHRSDKSLLMRIARLLRPAAGKEEEVVERCRKCGLEWICPDCPAAGKEPHAS